MNLDAKFLEGTRNPTSAFEGRSSLVVRQENNFASGSAHPLFCIYQLESIRDDLASLSGPEPAEVSEYLAENERDFANAVDIDSRPFTEREGLRYERDT